MLERLEKSDIPGVISEEFRYRLQDGGWCWVRQVVVGGSRFDFPEGVVRFYVFDIQNRKQRELGEVVIGHHAISKRSSLTGLRREKEFLADALERIRSHECEGWCLVALDITRDDGSVAQASLTSYAVQSDRLVFSYVLVLQMR